MRHLLFALIRLREGSIRVALAAVTQGERYPGPAALALLLAGAVGFHCLIHPTLSRQRDRQTIAAAKEISAALENYAGHEGGRFPASLAELSSEGYLKDLPRSPFTGLPLLAASGRPPRPGEYCYRALIPPGAKHARGYVLLLGSRSPAVPRWRKQMPH